MLIRNLSIHFFGSIRNLTIDFDKLTGLTVVEGPNGSGKTYAFIEAVVWLLFGRTIRKVPADGVRMEGRKEKTIVSGQVELDDGRMVFIERSRPGGMRYSFVSTLGNNTGSQQDLETLLGVDFKLFTTSVVFGGAGVSSFCSLSDSERKNVLERILDTAKYIKAGVDARSKLESVQEQRSAAETRLSILRDRVKSLRDDLDEIEKRAADFKAKRRNVIRSAKREIETLKSLVESQKARLNELVEAQKKVHSKYESRHRTWKARVDAAKASAKRAREIVSEALANQRLASKEVDDAQEAVDRIKNDDLPEVCPFCATPRNQWPDPKRKAVDAEGPMNRLQKAHVVLKKSKQSYAKARENLAACDSAVDDESENEPEKPGTEKIDRQRRDIDINRSRIKDAKSNLKKLRADKKNPYVGLMARKEREFERLHRKVKVFKARVKRLANDEALIAYWTKNFKALAAMLLDEAAPYLSKRAYRYAEKLMDGQITINFDPSSQGRGKSFLPVISNDNGGDSYEKSSKGERARIDLCILLALRDLMESRLTGKFNQIFLDEVFDGLDDEGISAVTNTLRKVFRKKSVFLITHNPSLKNAANNVLEFSKVNGETVVKGMESS